MWAAIILLKLPFLLPELEPVCALIKNVEQLAYGTIKTFRVRRAFDQNVAQMTWCWLVCAG